MNDLRTAAQQALQALEASLGWPHVIEALRERLAGDNLSPTANLTRKS